VDLIDVNLRTYPAKAVRVTEENMKEVAEWCGGYVESSLMSQRLYISIPVQRTAHVWNTECASVGQWVVKADEKFTAYKHASFMGKFAMREKDDLVKKRAKILAMVIETYGRYHYGRNKEQDSYIDGMTDKIMEVFG